MAAAAYVPTSSVRAFSLRHNFNSFNSPYLCKYILIYTCIIIQLTIFLLLNIKVISDFFGLVTYSVMNILTLKSLFISLIISLGQTCVSGINGAKDSTCFKVLDIYC